MEIDLRAGCDTRVEKVDRLNRFSSFTPDKRYSLVPNNTTAIATRENGDRGRYHDDPTSILTALQRRNVNFDFCGDVGVQLHLSFVEAGFANFG